MAFDTKLLRNRIKSVDSTLHLTSAMGLVASSKIRRAGEAMAHSREYADALASAVTVLTGSPECEQSPYMSRREGDRRRIVIIAGDRGLAGGYNANIFRLARETGDAEFIPIGKRACDRYGGGYLSAERFSYGDAQELAKRLCADFAAGEYDSLEILFTRYVSMMSQEATLARVLPLERTEKAELPSDKGAAYEAGVVFEPDEYTVLEAVVPEYIAGIIHASVRESFASEVAARRMAMDSAEKNARGMIADLQLAYNRARQGAITQEITEIVAGSGS